MRANPAHYNLVAPRTLSEALALLGDHPGRHTPIAGGTELMVAFNTGRLAQRSFLSLQHLHELRFIDTSDLEQITIGAATTFTDLRTHPDVERDLPMLAQAASWTGSVANQNRGTLGGNLVNASPAADSPPALLCYDTTLTLISTRGTRTLPYPDFHLGYKQTALAPDELLHSLTIKRNYPGYKYFLRKVGTRNAQAISKVALACLARLEPSSTLPNNIITDIRIAAASLADRPLRCHAAEAALLHQPLTPTTLAAARSALAADARPIDDIRSTARYRAAVAANLLEDFLVSLQITPQTLSF